MDSDFELNDPPFGYEAPPFVAQAFPRRYRLRPFSRFLQLALGAGLAIGGLAMLLWLAAAAVAHPGGSGSRDILWYLALIVAGLGLVCLWDGLRYEVVLFADGIELQSAWRRRRLALADIAGRRWQAEGYGFGALRLVARPGAGRDLKLNSALEHDADFGAWLARVEDLDQAQLRATQEALASDPAWGTTPEERWQRLRNYQVVVGLVAYAITGLVVASMVWRRDLDWPVWALAAVPPLMLLAVTLSRNRLRIDASRTDPRPSLFGPWAFATIALAARQAMEVDLQQWPLVILPALAAGGVLAAWAWRASAPMESAPSYRWPLLPLLPLAGLYAGAALVLLDVKLDHQAASEAERSVVTSKHWDNGRWRSYSLNLDPVTNRGSVRRLQVPLSLYNSVSPGETVCVMRHPGYFSWDWLDVKPCAGRASLSPSSSGAWPDALYRALAVGAYLPERRGPLLQQLLDKRYEELEARLGDLQQRFEQGHESSITLLVTYRAFYDPNPELDPLFDAWVARYPGSYAAYLARGIHRKFQAEQLHQAGFEKSISPEHNVEGITSRQVADLQHSTLLTPKPLLSYVHLMDAASYRGQREELRRLLERGLAVDPGSLALTRKYLWLQRPDLEAMAAFVEECRAAGMPASTLDSLQSILLVHRAWAANRAKDVDQALALLHQATALNAFGEDQGSALREAGVIELQRKHYEAARDLLQRAIAADPEKSGHHEALANALWYLGERLESVEEMRRAAELGLPSAQAYLGERLFFGDLLPRDEAAAAKWLGRADAAGNANARRLLREHPQLRRP